MKEESWQDLLVILERGFKLGDREGGWTPQRLGELGGKLQDLKLAAPERQALYPKMEEAGIKGDTAQAKALGVGRSTVQRDKGKIKSAPSGADSKGKSAPSGAPPVPKKQPEEDAPEPWDVVDTLRTLYNLTREVPVKVFVDWDGDTGRLPMWWEKIVVYVEEILEGKGQ